MKTGGEHLTHFIKREKRKCRHGKVRGRFRGRWGGYSPRRGSPRKTVGIKEDFRPHDGYDVSERYVKEKKSRWQEEEALRSSKETGRRHRGTGNLFTKKTFKPAICGWWLVTLVYMRSRKQHAGTALDRWYNRTPPGAKQGGGGQTIPSRHLRSGKNDTPMSSSAFLVSEGGRGLVRDTRGSINRTTLGIFIHIIPSRIPEGGMT